MTIEMLESRLTIVEAELANLKKRLEQETTPKTNPWLDQVFGIFKDDPLFDEAERYGREWRNAQRMDYDNDIDEADNATVSA